MAAATQNARYAARKAYEGGFDHGGELGESPYLRRAWPSFDLLVADGRFSELAEELLRPLLDALHAEGDKSRDMKRRTKEGVAA